MPDTPWLLLIVLLVAGLDAVLPFMPSESTVVAAGVLSAATGRPPLPALIAVAAVGAFLGDWAAYSAGRRGTDSVVARLKRGRRSRAVYFWVRTLLLHRNGALVVVFARYVPGGRSATAFAAGIVGFPVARFRRWTALGVLIWAVQAALLGFFGGAAFEEHPLVGLLVAYACAGLITGIALLVQRLFPAGRGGDADHNAIRNGSVSEPDALS